MQVDITQKHPIKMWTDGVPVEESALKQLRNVAALPFIHKHVAVMPDVHWGMGATVGSVIATRGAIVPAAVGVDIGCGMMAQRTTLRAEDLPDSLLELRTEIERVVPHGRTNNGGPGDRGAWHDLPLEARAAFNHFKIEESSENSMAWRIAQLFDKHPKLKGQWNGERIISHLGTLGTGNHFVEVCLDKQGYVWVMLHSGSRGIGNRIGSYFIERAKEDMRRWFINLPDADLAYIPQGSELFDDYCGAVRWAQEYALLNRIIMMRAAVDALADCVPKPFECSDVAVNCHHNYVSWENHLGANVIVTRKGAVRARLGRGRVTSESSRAAWGPAPSSCAARATRRASAPAATAPAGPCRAGRPISPREGSRSSAARTWRNRTGGPNKAIRLANLDVDPEGLEAHVHGVNKENR